MTKTNDEQILDFLSEEMNVLEDKVSATNERYSSPKKQVMGEMLRNILRKH